MAGIDSFTKLMPHMNGTDTSTSFPDDSDTAHTITAVSPAQVDTAQSVFGGASGLFDGGTAHLTVPNHTDFEMSGNDWTLDTRMRFTSHTGSSGILAHGDNGSNRTLFYWESTTGKLTFNAIIGGSSNLVESDAWTPNDGQWYHLEIDRSGNTIYFFADGVAIGSVAYSTVQNNYSAGNLLIGAQYNISFVSANEHDGHLDEFRFSVGTARHTSGFTPPTEEYTSGPVVTPSTLAITAALPVPTVIVPDATITPSALAITAAVLAPTIAQDVTITPSALTVTGAVLAPTVVTGQTVTPSALTLAATLETPFVTFSVNGGILNQDLPRLTLASSATIGWTLNKDLPKLQIDATMKSGSVLRLNKNLPKLTIDAKGAGIANNNLPRLLIDATMQVGSRARLNRNLPRLIIDASGTVGRNGQLNKDLPRLVIDATLVSGNFITLNKNLPRLILQARGFQGVSMTLNKNLPKLTIDATGFSDQAGTLNKDLLKLEIEAYGDSYLSRYI